MASTLEFQFSSLWSKRNDLLDLNQGLIRSVSVQSNLVNDKQHNSADLSSSRENHSDKTSITAKAKNGLLSRLDGRGSTSSSPHRNASYTCLTGPVIAQVKHQHPQQRCQSALTDASKDLKTSLTESQGTIKPTSNGMTHLRVPADSFCAISFQVSLNEKCTQIISTATTECLRSSNSESSDIKNVQSISPEVVAGILTLSSSLILMLDCRTFMQYNDNHITGALNVSCADCISRKRLMCGKATVGDMINGGEEAKMRYRQMMNNTSVQLLVYDGDTTDLEGLPQSHPLLVVITSLQKAGHSTYYLQGGLQSFHKNYGHLCSQPGEPLSRPLLYSPTTNVVDCQVDTAVISEILPSLYLGNERDASNRELLQSLSITHILNVTSQIPLHFEDDKALTYKRLPATDSCSQNLKQYFDDAVSFIDEATSKGQKVLVHCQAGVSRSASIVIAYIMTRRSVGMLEAYRYVKARRAIVAPNFNFMGQLLAYETTLTSRVKNSTGHDDNI